VAQQIRNSPSSGPKGKAGILVNYGVEGVTEVFAGSSVTPKIAVGISGNPDAYGEELTLTGLRSTPVSRF
jgi:hypothetical protein